MNNQINFTLKFEEHKCTVVFNPDEKAREMPIVGWQSAVFANAIGERINVLGRTFLLDQPDGVYLHRPLTDFGKDGLPDESIGYMTSWALEEAIAAKQVHYLGDIVEGGVYNLYSKFGTQVNAGFVLVHQWVETEPDWEDKKRNAEAKVMNLEILRKCEAQGVNIRLVYSDKQQARMDVLKEQWNLFLDGKYEELAKDIADRIADKKAKKAVAKAEVQAKTPEGKGVIDMKVGGTTVKLFPQGNVVDPNDLKGEHINFVEVKKNGTRNVLKSLWQVTDASVANLMYVTQKYGYEWHVLGSVVEQL